VDCFTLDETPFLGPEQYLVTPIFGNIRKFSRIQIGYGYGLVGSNGYGYG